MNPVVVTPVFTTLGLNGSRPYDGTTIVKADIFALSGLVGSETLSLGGAGTVADKNVGTNKPVTLGTLTLGNGTGLASNYTLAGGTHVATITPAPITAALTAGSTGVSKTYDGNTLAALTSSNFALSGFLGADSASVIKTVGNYANKNVGNNLLIATSLTPADFSVGAGTVMSNYVFPTSVSANIGVIKPASLTMTGVTAQNKVYDATTLANLTGGKLVGVVTGDAVTAGTLTGAFADKKVGTAKPVTVSGLTLGGADAGNYVLNASAVVATANITPRPLTVSGITAVSKVYDGTSTATLNTATASLSGLINGDAVGISATGSFANKNVGNGKTVTLTSSHTGTDATNYSFTDQATASADITPKALSVSGLTAANKVYDGSTTASLTGGALAGAIAGDSVSLGVPTGTFGDKNVGTAKPVTVTGLVLSGADLGNYTLPAAATNIRADITEASDHWQRDCAQ
ncbi:MAG: hypothetical protein IPG23_19270 [Burkholderiales bacterium]|nr:hypothetical protein [Burkholderiales bacterium]